MNRYDRKYKTRRKLSKLYHEKKSYFVSEKEDENNVSYLRPLYLSGCRKLAKKQTNRRLRKMKNTKSLKGCAYRKEFDYWNTLF